MTGMAKEYIDKAIAVKGLRMAHDLDGADFVANIPAADVRENVRARWTVVSKAYEFADGSKAAWNVWICPICGYERTAGWEYTSPGEKPKAKLCEMCGAQMGGAEDG